MPQPPQKNNRRTREGLDSFGSSRSWKRTRLAEKTRWALAVSLRNSFCAFSNSTQAEVYCSSADVGYEVIYEQFNPVSPGKQHAVSGGTNSAAVSQTASHIANIRTAGYSHDQRGGETGADKQYQAGCKRRCEPRSRQPLDSPRHFNLFLGEGRGKTGSRTGAPMLLAKFASPELPQK